MPTFAVTLRDRFFDTVHTEYVEATDFDDAVEQAFELAPHGLPYDFDVDGDDGSSASITATEELVAIETRVLLRETRHDFFVEVIVQATTADEAVASALKEREGSEVIAVEAAGQSMWWTDASKMELPQPWEFWKPSTRRQLRLIPGGAV